MEARVELASQAWPQPRQLRLAVLVALCIMAVVAVGWVAFHVRTVLILALVAATVAYVAEPVVWRLVHRGLPRSVAAIVVGVSVAALEALAIGWLLPSVARQGADLVRELPGLAERLVDRFGLPIDVGALVHTATGGDVGARLAQEHGGQVMGIARAAVGFTASFTALALLFPVLVSLMVVHLPGVMRVFDYVPRDRRDEWRRIALAMDVAVGGFFRGRVIISTIIGALLAGGWAVVGVPHALALGLLAGVLNLVPFASTLAWLLAIVLGFADGDGSWLSVFVWPSVVFFAVNGLENSVLTPWIQSQAVSLSALTVMLATLIGGSVGGAVGLFYAIPVAACVKTLLREAWLPRLRAWAETRDLSAG
jgi:predicted PurR-regulated permease PerM